MAARPNVLLVTFDQWRGDCLSAVGHPAVKTPNADALAAEGVLFKRHYAGAAPCSPARACLYTGLYQMNNRVCRNGTPLDSRHGNLALAAREAGYDPTLFGYTDVAQDPRHFAPGDPFLTTYEGVLPGFTVRQLLPEHQKQWRSWLSYRGVPVTRRWEDMHVPAGVAAEPITNAPPVYAADQTPAAFLTNEFLRWHGEQDGTGWFAHISYLSPHPPFIAPEPYNAMYGPGDGPGFSRAGSLDEERALHPYVEWEIGKQTKDKFRPRAEGRVSDWNDEDLRMLRAIYYGMISEADAQFGRLLGALKAAGQWNDTIVVLTSDHAEMMGDHFMLGKGGFFEGSFHIPLIIRSPGAKRRVVERFTEAVDIFPTLLDLIGAETRPHLDGVSLRPLLDGRTPRTWRDAAHWEFDFRSIGEDVAEQHFGLRPQQCNLSVIRGKRFKYVHFGGGLPPLLFDLESDPTETRNLAGEPQFAPVRLSMAEALLAWRAEHLDQTLALSRLAESGVEGSYARLPFRS